MATPPAAASAPTALSPATTPSPAAPLVEDHGPVRHAQLRAVRWAVKGETKVLGNAEAQDVDISGVVTIGGGLTAAAVRSDGTVEVGGRAEVAGAWTAAGNVRVGDSLTAGSIDARGPIRVGKDLTVRGSLASRVRLEVGGDLKTGSARLEGHLTATGAVDVAELDANLEAASRLGRVTGRSVRVRRGGRVGSGLRVTIDRVEAEHVELAGVEAEFVRANAAVLGADTRVTRLECDTVRRHRTAIIGPESRTPRPRGLSH